MKLGKKEQVFKMSWIEKLKLLGIIPSIYAMMMLLNVPLLTNYRVILVVSLIVMFPITVFLLYQLIFIYNKKIVILGNTLIYYKKRKECYRAEIGRHNIKIYDKEKGTSKQRYRIKYLSINDYEIPIYLLGTKGMLNFEKAIYEIWYKKSKVRDKAFKIQKKELIVKKRKEIFISCVFNMIPLIVGIIVFSSNTYMIILFIIIYLLLLIFKIVFFIRMKLYTPENIRISADIISIDNTEYSKYDIQKLMFTSLQTQSEKLKLFGYRTLKIFENDGRRIYTLILSSDLEFKNFRINENYESLYEEIIKFCIVNEIEYELV
ncbi:hypothetical protein [Leptotrichia shahii]|uniref:hypothetical protein n=1 Tax=Leptotrichia shahii TaxID=157691 RepID=UPI0004774A1B|nr:hypothetical protein [Leptotrichia shahii]